MKILIIISLSLFLVSCSIFQVSEKDENKTGNVEEVYVFDEVSDTQDQSDEAKSLKDEVDNTFTNLDERASKNNTDNSQNLSKSYDGNVFYLQLGAFTTLKRAEQFKDEINSKVPFKLSIIFNTNNSLYTVRSSPYSTKEEINEIKNGFWKQNLFLDAFIVTE